MRIHETNLSDFSDVIGLSPEELEGEVVTELPTREAMSVTSPFLGHLLGGKLLAKGLVALVQSAHEAPMEEGP
jgi:hypothetical protein